MARSYVVDTHALIWYLEGNPRLGDAVRAALDDHASIFYLSAIALAEACWIVEHGRTRIPSVVDLLADVDADPRLILCPLDRLVLDASLSLTNIPEMHDRFIVAAAVRLAQSGEDVAILSRDATIAAGAPVPVVWASV